MYNILNKLRLSSEYNNTAAIGNEAVQLGPQMFPPPYATFSC